MMILCLSLIPLIIISLFSRPYLDDYNYAMDTVQLIQSGNWNVVSLVKTAFDVDMHFYNHWQGLYTSAFILALHPGIFGEEYYFIGAWVLMLLLISSIYFLTSKIATVLIPSGIKKRYILFFSLFVFTVIMQGMPSLIQGIYWFNGAWNYTFFFCMVLINVGLMIGYANGKNAKGGLVISTVLSFLISGGNHVTAFLNILLLLIAVLCVMNKKKGIFIPFISAVIGFIIMYSAPGTAARQGEELKQGLISTVAHTVWWCYKYLCDWMNIQWFCFLLLLVPVAFFLIRYTDIDVSKFKVHPIFMILAELMLICGMLCVPYMAMGNFGKSRLTNVIWCTFMICSAANWIYLLLWSKILASIKNFEFKKIYIFFILGACFIICFYADANVFEVTEELIAGRALEYLRSDF